MHEVASEDDTEDAHQPSEGEDRSVRIHRVAEERQGWNARQAVLPASKAAQLDRGHMNDDAERKGRHRQMVPPQPEYQPADRPSGDRGERRRKRNRQPRVKAEELAQHGRTVGAEANEGCVAERDLPRIAHEQREAKRRQREQRRDHEEVHHVAVAGEIHGREQRGESRDAPHRFTSSSSPSSPLGRTNRNASRTTNAMAFL